ncbi:FAD:protein FMN transferase [Dyadobacter sp. MSC1_007]|jgi:thiamine biosynthesis lipoprotein|uniref:FAD:protein FMN transferase n=1 Tax=Dyadobacter sp. MSC1_007 TaxID=2909264 RepID=UPI0020303213|nr:FAD:protein FMN transferase [Dyadobacter sp. MSC1_007]
MIFRIAGVFSFLFLSVLPLTSVAVSERETAMISISGEAQGTTYHIKYYDPKNRNFKPAIDSILTEFDKCLSLYRPDSELSAFNSGNAHTIRQRWFYQVLKRSEEIYNATGGAFDPTIMPLAEAYGFGANKTFDPENLNLDSLLALVSFKNIRFDSISVRKTKPGVKLDFNGIAQGYSVDIIGKFLRDNAIARYMVEIGGEVLCAGQKIGGNHWVTGIENPMKPNALVATVKLSDRAMTTAGNYHNHFTKNGQTFNHIIDPRTGSMEQTDLLSVTVFARDAMTADGYDTAFFVMGLEPTKTFLKNRKDIDVYMLYTNEEGQLLSFMTDGIKDFIQEK